MWLSDLAHLKAQLEHVDNHNADALRAEARIEEEHEIDRATEEEIYAYTEASGGILSAVCRRSAGRFPRAVGSVYVGRDSRFGRTRFGNWAATVRKSTSRRDKEHERCVLLFAQQVAQSSQEQFPPTDCT